MRRRRKSTVDEADIDMTPMLDIVFIMLIFFIVTATFLDERGVDLTQPPPPPDDDTPTNPKPAITVYVDNQSICSVDSNQTECDRVSLAVERLLADKPGANIILRVNESARHGMLVTLKDEFDEKGLGSKVEIVKNNT
jgi:biopolymer transport protein ExbD